MKTKEKFPQLNDIIFENRNKSYGAYELRTRYTSRLSKAFLFTLICSSILFLLLYFSRTKRQMTTVITTKDSVIFSQIFFKVEDKPELYQTRSADQSSAGKPQRDVFAIVNDSMPVSNDTAGTNVKNELSDTVTVMGGGGDTTNYKPGREYQAFGTDTFSPASVDKQPEFPGGLEKFYRYLVNRIHYTREAKNARLNKRSYVSFIVNEEGLISDVIVLNNIGFGLDESVKEVLLNSPKWSPGIVRNQSVKTKMVLPVNFRLAQ